MKTTVRVKGSIIFFLITLSTWGLSTESFTAMLVGGDQEISIPEVVHIANNTVNSDRSVLLDDHPLPTSDNLISLRGQGKVIVCSYESSSAMECHGFALRNFSLGWTRENYTMLQERSHAATALFGATGNNIWLVSGGMVISRRKMHTLNSSEMFSINTFFEGPSMPEAVSMHCMVRVDSERIFSIGGKSGSENAVNSMYMLGSDYTWIGMPSMELGKYGHSCGHYNEEDIIVVGGLAENARKTERFSIIFSRW